MWLQKHLVNYCHKNDQACRSVWKFLKKAEILAQCLSPKKSVAYSCTSSLLPFCAGCSKGTKTLATRVKRCPCQSLNDVISSIRALKLIINGWLVCNKFRFRISFFFLSRRWSIKQCKLVEQGIHLWWLYFFSYISFEV